MIVLPFPPPATRDFCGAGSASQCADTQNPAHDLRRLLSPIGGREYAEGSRSGCREAGVASRACAPGQSAFRRI